MEFYLLCLDKYDREVGEKSPFEILMCSEGSDEQIEFFQLDDAGIKVAQYFTELPSKEVLRKYPDQQKLIAERQIEDRTDKE